MMEKTPRHKVLMQRSSEIQSADSDQAPQAVRIIPLPLQRKEKYDSQTTYIRLPSFNKVTNDPALYAHASTGIASGGESLQR